MRSVLLSVGRFVRMTPFERGDAIERRPLLSSFLFASIPTAVFGLVLFWIAMSAPKPGPRWEFTVAYVVLLVLWIFAFISGYKTLLRRANASTVDAQSAMRGDGGALEQAQSADDLCSGGWQDFPNRGEWWAILAVFALVRGGYAVVTFARASSPRAGGALWGCVYVALFVVMSWWRTAQLSRRMAKWRDAGPSRPLELRVWNASARRMSLKRGPDGWLLTDGTRVETLAGSPAVLNRWQRWGATRVRVGDGLRVSPFARFDLASMPMLPIPRRFVSRGTASEQLREVLATPE